MINLKNYASLKEAVKVWLNRNDSATQNAIPSFISLAEDALKRLVKFPDLKETMLFKITDWGDDIPGTVPLPHDYDSAKSLVINGKVYYRHSVEKFYSLVESKNCDLPIFTEIGKRLHTFPACKIGDDVQFIYYRDWDLMTVDTDNPTHLEKAPDVMLFLSLRYGALFLRDNDMSQYWEQKAQEAVTTLLTKLDDDEWSGSTLVVTDQGGSYE